MFINKDEKEICEEYLENGYVIRKVADINSLEWIKNFLLDVIIDVTNNKSIDRKKIFDDFHKFVNVADLNDVRVKIIQRINDEKEFRSHYYSLAKPYLDFLVGNEIAMQMRTNLSIQLPKDSSSLLPFHTDTWSGDSPYEIVAWLPMVDCFDTKSMFILDPKNSSKLNENFFSSMTKSSEDLFLSLKDKLKWIEINYGEILLFNQGLPHGNRINEEKDTRWSMNVRFKSVFTPYGDKKIGEFFEPITLKACSIVGMNYKFPK